MVVALAFALATGVAECVVYAVERYVRHRFTFESPQALWMAPVAYLAFFLPIAAVVSASAVVMRRRPPAAWVVGATSALSIFALLLPQGRIWPWASALLAAGFGVRLAKLAARSPERWIALCRRAAAVLAAWVVLAAFGLYGIRALTELRALAVSPEVPGDSPNVLIIVFDTVRRGNLHLYGYTRPTTPNIERLAAEGVVFDQAVSPAPWTLPTHVALFTGAFPTGRMAGDWQRVPRLPAATLTSVLGSRGYATGGFTANLSYTSRESGLARGFAHFEGYPVTPLHVILHASFARTALARKLTRCRSLREVAGVLWELDLHPTMTPSAALKPAPLITDGFLRWQRSLGDRPFFAFLNYFEAHEPYRPPAPYRAMFSASPSKLDAYDGAIAYLDVEVGRLVDSLRARGLLDRTLVVLTADHGEQFGEHRLYGHANSLYLPALQVPLVMRYPAAIPPGRRIADLVTLRDVAATVSDLVGIGSGSALRGQSLARAWHSGGSPRTVVMAELAQGINVDPSFPNSRGSLAAIIDRRFEYIRNSAGGDELYAYRTDTLELRNLVHDTGVQGHLARLRAVLDSAQAAAVGGGRASK